MTRSCQPFANPRNGKPILIAHRYLDAVPCHPLGVAKGCHYRDTVHDLQHQCSAISDDATSFAHHRFVFLFCLEEAERIHDDHGIGGFATEGYLPHVTPNPMDVSPSGLGELLCPAQKGNREIEPEDGGAKFRKRKRVATMTATDINDSRNSRQLEKVPNATGLASHVIGGCKQSPALAVTTLEVVVSPVRHSRVWLEFHVTTFRKSAYRHQRKPTTFFDNAIESL